jgi:lipopolysaccharide export system permease protein
VTCPTILDRYVFREITFSFLFCFAIFLVTGLIAGFLPLLQKGMEHGLALTLILFEVLISALPGTLVTVLPLSIMIGVLLGLGRMAADNEIAAIKASGIPVLRLLPPVVLLGVAAYSLSMVCTLVLIPKGVAEGRRLIHEALTKRADAGIEERTFFDRLKNLIVYVEAKDPQTGVMSRVFVRESSQPDEVVTIIAQKGKVVPDPEGKAFALDLRNGTILKEDRNGDSTGTLAFESYLFRFPLDQANLESAQQSLEEMSVSKIQNHVESVTRRKPEDPPDIQAYYDRVRRFARILITQRFTYPLACLALCIAAFPLGVLSMGKSRLNNVSLGLVGVFFYYAFTLAVERAARSGLAPPEIVLPLPAVVFSAVSAYLIHCVQQEKMPAFVYLLQRVILRLRGRTY